MYSMCMQWGSQSPVPTLHSLYFYVNIVAMGPELFPAGSVSEEHCLLPSRNVVGGQLTALCRSPLFISTSYNIHLQVVCARDFTWKQ